MKHRDEIVTVGLCCHPRHARVSYTAVKVRESWRPRGEEEKIKLIKLLEWNLDHLETYGAPKPKGM